MKPVVLGHENKVAYSFSCGQPIKMLVVAQVCSSGYVIIVL